jgi:DMSO/TMAO reductase YedYZ molybdopterin-dependent catalytic subunit
VAAALAAMPFAVRHVLVRRQRPRPSDASRRSVLRLFGLAAAAGAAYLAVDGVASLLGLPGRQRRATGSYEVGSSVPHIMPVTQWLGDTVPDIDVGLWSVRLVTPTGTRRLDYGELAAGTDTVRAVLDCTGGWYAMQDWRGIRLDRLLPHLDPRHSIEVVSVTGYRRRLPAADAAGLVLATHVAGLPLSAGHGAPVRLVAPGRRGFWWVKWVNLVQVVDAPWWWQSPAPLQ